MNNKIEDNFENDPELKRAIEISMQEQCDLTVNKLVNEPNEKDPDCVKMCFRVANGKRFNRMFLISHTIGDLYNYA